MTDEQGTLGEMTHTNPYTGRVFGATQTYTRGKTVAADGGEADAAEDIDSEDDDSETLADVAHTSSDDVETDGPQRTFDRGGDR